MPTVNQPHTEPPIDLEADFMRSEEFRRRLGLGRSTFYDLAKTDALPVPTLRVGRSLLFSRRAYEALLELQQSSE